jgi:hypothetical protein
VQDETIYPLEFKKSCAPYKSMVRHFGLLDQLKMPVKQGGIICLSETLLPITENVSAIPVGLL